MNDKELLRLAAKAAGIKLIFMQNDMPRNCTGMHDSMNIFSAPAWNPLTDDGDALRLVVKLGIDVLQLEKSKSAYANNSQVFYSNAADPYAATRLAIVRAAAEIGKSK